MSRTGPGLSGSRRPDPDLGLAARALAGADQADFLNDLPPVPVQPRRAAPGDVAELRRHLVCLPHVRVPIVNDLPLLIHGSQRAAVQYLSR